MNHRQKTRSPVSAVASLFVASVLAGSSLMISSHGASAQEAPAVSDSGCSGVLCLFGSRPAPQPVRPAEADQTAQQATEAETSGDAKPDVKPKPAKPTITIAAEATEMGRLKSLAAAMPNENVKIVPASTASGSAKHGPTDFSVATTLEQADGSEKTRLFTEQMHVVAGPSVKTLADLRDKVVSFGPDKGPSQAAPRKAFAALDIAVRETPLDLDNALDGIATGDVDAVVVLAPQPLARLRIVKGLHLISWPDGVTLPAGAVTTSIDGASYPGLAKPDETIKTMGVDAVLTLNEKTARKPAAKRFLTDLSQRSGTLARHGFDLIKADVETRSARRVASDDRR